MKRKSQIMLVLLSLLLLLTACGGNSGKNSNNNPSSNSNNSSNQSNGSGSANNEEIKELNVIVFNSGAVPQDFSLIQDAVNEFIKDKIHAKVNMTLISPGDYVQKTNLLLTGSEKVDLMVVSPFFGFYNQVARGQLQPLDELIDQYGADIKAVLGDEYLNASRVNGQIYGIVPMKDMASGTSLMMRKDLVEKYNIDVESIKSFADIEPVLKVIKENEPDLTPLVPGAAGMNMLFQNKWYDELGDGFGVLPNHDNDLKVVNLYETERYEQEVRLMRDWYQKGYILKDAATSKESQYDLVKANRAFAYATASKVGIESQDSANVGMPMVAAQYQPPASTTNSVVSFMWGVPQNAGSPDKAVQFVNLMFKEKDLTNLLAWGIEGTHYDKVSDNVIKYPEGITAANATYVMHGKYLFGNQFMQYTLEGADPEQWTKMDEFNKSAIKSKALGFSFDSTPVKTEVAAVTNVVDKYRRGLESGTLNPDEQLPEFIQKLKEAGIDKIIAEKQKQLDEWAAVNK